MDHCIAYRWPSASPQGGTAYLILWPSGRAHLGAAENPEAANAAIARRTREFGTGLFALFDRRPSDEPLPDGAEAGQLIAGLVPSMLVTVVEDPGFKGPRIFVDGKDSRMAVWRHKVTGEWWCGRGRRARPIPTVDSLRAELRRMEVGCG